MITLPRKDIRGRAGPPASARRGVTLIELLIAMSVVVVALLGTTSALYFSDANREATREKVLAQNAARKVIEQMRDANFSTLLASYTTGSPGSTFTVERLNAISGVPVGQIAFPMQGSNLRESVIDADWGMPRDLNGDGLIDNNPHNADYKLLPVRITVRWRSVRGQGQIVVNALITLR